MENTNLQLLLGRNEDDFPVTLDFENSTNRHILLCGSSGSGKTVEAQFLIAQLVKQGETILTCNIHGSLDNDQIFPDFLDTFETHRNDIFAHDSGIPLDFFRQMEFADGTRETYEDTAGATSDIIARALKLGVKQRALLRIVTESAFKNRRDRQVQFSDIARQLLSVGSKAATELYERLFFLFQRDLFVEGEGAITQGKINILQFTKFDLEIQEALQELVLAYIWRTANTGRFKKKNLWLFIDECQNVSHESSGALARMISEGRKMGINLILATQLILQGSTNTVQQRLPQAGLMLFFKPTANRMGLTAKMISPGDIETWSLRLRCLRVGEFVAVGNYLIGGLPINYPVVISARSDDSASIET